MNRKRRQPGLTLLETRVAVSIILMLIGVLATAGKKLRLRSEIMLTRSTMDVLDAALEVYHDVYGDFVPMAATQAQCELALLGTVPPNTVAISSGAFPNTDWDNAVLYYLLRYEPKSRQVVGSLVPAVLNWRDVDGVKLQIEIPTGATEVPGFRVVDAWDTPLDYQYAPTGSSFPGTADFPRIRSAGPDKVFDTEDDLTNL